MAACLWPRFCAAACVTLAMERFWAAEPLLRDNSLFTVSALACVSESLHISCRRSSTGERLPLCADSVKRFSDRIETLSGGLYSSCSRVLSVCRLRNGVQG